MNRMLQQSKNGVNVLLSSAQCEAKDGFEHQNDGNG